MGETLHGILEGWHDFYLITGTAAASLTGLQFVVQTLIASGDARRAAADADAEESIAAFGTPTVVHFALALVLSSVLCAPWPDQTGLRETLAVLGVGALLYSAIVLRRARNQGAYVPVAEDWIWHVVLPGMAYAAVLVASILLERDETGALFTVALATLVLLCIGIHNAWDTVIYLTIGTMQHEDAKPAPAKEPRRESRGHRKGHR